MQVPTIQRSGSFVPAAPPPDSGMALVAVKAPLAGLVVAGTALTAVTLGLYRFWYRTALRRYYWRNTRLAGDGFEYTGTGRELFVGFLIALAIVLPIYLVVTLIGLFGGEVLGTTIAGIIGTLIMPAVVQVLSYRARRYRLTRTRYRRVQFHQSGSGTAYLARTAWWLALSIVSLGIAFPFFRRALERYKIENTWFGSAQGAFEANAGGLMGPWMAFWVAGFVSIVLIFGNLGYDAETGMSLARGLLAGVLILGLLFVALPLLWLRYRVREFRVFVAGTRFGNITLESNLATGAVVWVWVTYGFALLALCGGFAMGLMAGGLVPEFTPDGGLESFPLATVPALLLAVAGFLVGLALVTELVFRRRLWALRVGSVHLFNLHQLDDVVQRAGLNATGIGEAFDTGFDVAG